MACINMQAILTIVPWTPRGRYLTT
jgi:hypothetical protein